MHENKKYSSRPDGPVKIVTLIEHGADYTTSWDKQHFDGSHFRIGPDGGEQYGIAIKEFHDTHIEVEGGWRKSVSVGAYLCEQVHQISTIVGGKTEVEEADVPIGYWVVTNPGGEQYAMPASEFRERYVAA